MNPAEKASFHAGEAKAHTEEKTSQAADKAGGILQSAKESAIQAGAVAQTKAGEAVEAVKNATGMNKK
ncbi:hypothetical protein [Klebsiella pneumoniae]|uniref:hypothetical protein n=1 Tax=Klebsiella pneumoniae TaxID=573 RepID=UPI000D5919F4|nr:hypothetical protein [Klebsiella pneumoniae]